ncbi:MAG: hypothetical protein JWP04_738 [Belnapia sp.]|nr:hypothetical protein [Belnapia sp.]
MSPGIGRADGMTPSVPRGVLAAGVSAWPLLGLGALWLGAVGLELVAGRAVVWLAGQHGPALLAVLLNLLVLWRFAASLRPGAVPLITRYARCDPAGLPPAMESYTRRLTLAWTWLLGLCVLAHAAAPAGLWNTGTVAGWEAAACAALFLGEHLMRSRRFPQLGRATPWRTLRAIRRSAGRPHGP